MSQQCGECNAKLRKGEPTLLVDDKMLCRSCHDQLRPICPHCRRLLPQAPKQAGPCPHCGKGIVIHADQVLYRTTLLTPEQRDYCDAATSAIAPFVRFGLDQRHYHKVVHDHKTETGREPTPYDISRKLFYMAGKVAPRTLRPDVFRQEAELVYSHEHNPHYILRKAQMANLENLRARGTEKVRLVGPTDRCRMCKRLCGDELDLDTAIASPMAPFQECPQQAIIPGKGDDPDRRHEFAFCEAQYVAVVAEAVKPGSGAGADDAAGLEHDDVDAALAAAAADSDQEDIDADQALRPGQDIAWEQDEKDQKVDPVKAKVNAMASLKAVNATGKEIYKIGDVWVDETNTPVPVLMMSHGEHKGVWVFQGRMPNGKANYRKVPSSRVQAFVQEVLEDQPELAERRKTDPTAVEEIWQAVEGVVLLALMSD